MALFRFERTGQVCRILDRAYEHKEHTLILKLVNLALGLNIYLRLKLLIKRGFNIFH